MGGTKYLYRNSKGVMMRLNDTMHIKIDGRWNDTRTLGARLEGYDMMRVSD